MNIQTATFFTGFLITFAGFAWWSHAVIVEGERGPTLAKALLITGGIGIIASIWMGVSV